MKILLHISNSVRRVDFLIRKRNFFKTASCVISGSAVCIFGYAPVAFGMEEKQNEISEEQIEKIPAVLKAIGKAIEIELKGNYHSGGTIQHFCYLLNRTVKCCRENKNKSLALAIQRVFLYYLRNFFQGNKVDEKLAFFQELFDKDKFVKNSNCHEFLGRTQNWKKDPDIPGLQPIETQIYDIKIKEDTKESEEIKKISAKLREKSEKMSILCNACVPLLRDDAIKAYDITLKFLADLGFSEEKVKKEVLEGMINGKRINKFFKQKEKFDSKLEIVKDFCENKLKPLGYEKLNDNNFIKHLKYAKRLKEAWLAQTEVVQKNIDEIYNRIKNSLGENFEETTAYSVVMTEVGKIVSEKVDEKYLTKVFRILHKLNEISDILENEKNKIGEDKYKKVLSRYLHSVDQKVKDSDSKKEDKVSSKEVFQSVSTTTNYA